MRRNTHLSSALAALAVALLSGSAIAAPKQELVLAIGGEPDGGYDPLLGWGRYGHPLFQSTLLTRDENLATVPDLATEWTLSDDRLVWTLKLRADVLFSNGAPLTAEDVAFTFTEAAKAGGTVDITVMESATAVDATTVEIKLKQPWITFADTFYTLGIVPMAGYGEGYSRAPIGSGPFKLVSWTEGEQLIVEANPNYYGGASPFTKITFLFTDEDTSLAAAQAGQVDMVSVPPATADVIPTGFDKVVVDSVDNRGITFPIPAAGSTNEEGDAIGNAITSDVAIRRAINLGIDRDVLVEVALLGHGSPAQGPADGLPWSNPEAAVPYNLEGARSLLDEAGWVQGNDGVRVKDGVRASFPINYPSSDSTRQALAATLSELLKPLGIEGTATGRSWEDIERIMHSEPVLFGWGSHSPIEIYSLYESSYGGLEYYNAGYFSNPAIDALFAAAQGAESLEASFPLWQQAEWNGTTGFGPKGDAGWAWLVNLDHVYFVDQCLDIGATQIEPHGHGWPITAMIQNWRWTCE